MSIWPQIWNHRGSAAMYAPTPVGQRGRVKLASDLAIGGLGAPQTDAVERTGDTATTTDPAMLAAGFFRAGQLRGHMM